MWLKSHRCQFSINKIPRLGVWWTGRIFSIKTNQLWNSVSVKQFSCLTAWIWNSTAWNRPGEVAHARRLQCHSSHATALLRQDSSSLPQRDSSSPVLQLLPGKHNFQWEQNVLQDIEGRLMQKFPTLVPDWSISMQMLGPNSSILIGQMEPFWLICEMQMRI